MGCAPFCKKDDTIRTIKNQSHLPPEKFNNSSQKSSEKTNHHIKATDQINEKERIDTPLLTEENKNPSPLR